MGERAMEAAWVYGDLALVMFANFGAKAHMWLMLKMREGSRQFAALRGSWLSQGMKVIGW